MMQIELAVNSACRVENAAGQSLTFRNGAWEGDMAASGVSMNCFDDTTMTLEIPYTEALHYTHESGDSNSPFLRDTVAAESKLTIRDPWVAQEDVVVKVDS